MNRRNSILVAMLCIANGAMAQSVEDGLKNLYYGKYQSAKTDFEKVIAAKPTEDKAYYYLGISELGLENKAAAAAAFSKGLTAVPNSPLLTAGLGRIDLLNGNKAEAKQKFEAASTATQGRNGDVARAIADANTEVSGGDRGYALSVMQTLLNNEGRKRKEQYTATAADYIELGDAYRYLGGENGGKAIEAYDQAIVLDPKNAEAVLKQGFVNYNAKLLEAAVADMTKATNIDENYGPAYFELYQFYYTPKPRQFSLANAKNYLQKYLAVADQTDLVKNEYFLSSIMFYDHDYKGAIAKAESLMPKANDSYKGKLQRLISDSYLQQGDSLNAKKVMDARVQAIGESKLEAMDYKLLSAIYTKLKSEDSATQANNAVLAVNYIEKYALSDTPDIDRYRETVEAFKTQRNWAKAAEWFGKLAEFKDNSQAINDLFFKGVYEHASKNYTQAEQTWVSFTEKYPTQPLGFYHLGNAQFYQDLTGKDDKPKAAFTKYIELAEPEADKNKKNLLFAYTYMMLNNYHAENKEQTTVYLDKVLALDPANETAAQIKESYSQAAKPAPAAGSKTTQTKSK
ncbi:tetratricopeptide repeat protein [Chitinophaga skermanii]|uniref:Tetratricopeptide repeat protein n=1 Tax=Chitinophaga skermanii TaxID=331697 RepID=A0A327Q9L7_9BACT|nr:tetratricopeptide repeat protein [Chitinophaga skermanii]RAI98506.1 tetratricopeptide repeat protein [Chitinophaga skermanii]